MAAGRKTIPTVQCPERVSDVRPDSRTRTTLRALDANTGLVWVSDGPDVYAKADQEHGVPLWPGESREFDLPADQLWIDVVVADEGVTWHTL